MSDFTMFLMYNTASLAHTSYQHYNLKLWSDAYQARTTTRSFRT